MGKGKIKETTKIGLVHHTRHHFSVSWRKDFIYNLSRQEFNYTTSFSVRLFLLHVVTKVYNVSMVPRTVFTKGEEIRSEVSN